MLDAKAKKSRKKLREIKTFFLYELATMFLFIDTTNEIPSLQRINVANCQIRKVQNVNSRIQKLAQKSKKKINSGQKYFWQKLAALLLHNLPSIGYKNVE